VAIAKIRREFDDKSGPRLRTFSLPESKDVTTGDLT
jgi:hypothetical protein